MVDIFKMRGLFPSIPKLSRNLQVADSTWERWQPIRPRAANMVVGKNKSISRIGSGDLPDPQ